MAAEPRNPFFDLLTPASVLFVATVLAYALVPPVQQPVWLLEHGWQLLLIEVGVILLLGLLSMGLDRLRSLRKASTAETIAANKPGEPLS